MEVANIDSRGVNLFGTNDRDEKNKHIARAGCAT